jgi:hypothetical protein
MILRDRFHDIANDIIYEIIWYYVYLKLRWYHRKMYDIIYDIYQPQNIYDIIVLTMISYAISYLWYHTYDFTYDILWYQRNLLWYHRNLWYHSSARFQMHVAVEHDLWLLNYELFAVCNMYVNMHFSNVICMQSVCNRALLYVLYVTLNSAYGTNGTYAGTPSVLKSHFAWSSGSETRGISTL